MWFSPVVSLYTDYFLFTSKFMTVFLNLKTLQDISRNYAPFPETLDANV